ncbi:MULTISPECIES: SRPBCC family protein [Streptomyces]|uniref:SRPBCC family protein n=1 Tax=Streptomyces TaxID=1883 RepID=UPI00068B23FD|nr:MULTISPECIES: SRPBCC family protein [Streptomyces]MCX4960128.1 SRPBCC family protein [Streptomyces virginiae]
MMQRQMQVEESLFVKAARTDLYDAVADVRAMARYSPECRAVLGPRGPLTAGRSFVGLNRKGPFVWFTWCRVVHAEAPERFTFEVSTFGLPVARWSYRFTPGDGGVHVTESWQDLRTGRGARLTELLGLLFTGTPARGRAELNRAGMRTTLRRLRHAVER